MSSSVRRPRYLSAEIEHFDFRNFKPDAHGFRLPLPDNTAGPSALGEKKKVEVRNESRIAATIWFPVSLRANLNYPNCRGVALNPNSEVWRRSRPRRRPRCVGVFCAEKSPIVPQLFYAVILIVKHQDFRGRGRRRARGRVLNFGV